MFSGYVSDLAFELSLSLLASANPGFLRLGSKLLAYLGLLCFSKASFLRGWTYLSRTCLLVLSGENFQHFQKVQAVLLLSFFLHKGIYNYYLSSKQEVQVGLPPTILASHTAALRRNPCQDRPS